MYRDCSEWFTQGYETSGVYNINPDNGETAFEVDIPIIIKIYLIYMSIIML